METLKTEEEIKAEEAATIEAAAVEEAKLDKSLVESIASAQAGNELPPSVKVPEVPGNPPTGPGETGPTPTGPGETGPAPTGPGETGPAPTGPVPAETGPTGPGETGSGETGPAETGPTGYEFRIPNKGKFESDESFEKRVELLDLVKKRKLATTPEQREKLSEDIKTTKSQIKNLNGTDRFINPLNQKPGATGPGGTGPGETGPIEDAALTADKERLRALGGATKEDIQDAVQQQALATDVKNTLDSFVDRHAELKDVDTREVFFDFVDANYNWQGKGGKDLMTVLELARESMFRPSETIQERVLAGANVQEKVNAMQFPGGTVAKTDYSPEMRKSLDELTATGLSEEKAIELLSD